MINILRIGVSTPSFFLFFCESILIYVSVFLANWLRFCTVGESISIDILLYKGLIVVFFITLALYYLDGYSAYFYTRRREFLFFWIIMQAIALGYIFLAFFYYLFPDAHLGRGILLGHFIITPILLYIWRLLFSWLFPKTGLFVRKAIIMGNSDMALQLHKELEARSYSGFSILHCGERFQESRSMESFLEGLWTQGVRYIIVTEELLSKLSLDFLWHCHLFGYQIIDCQTLYEWITGKIPYDAMQPRDILFVYRPANLYITRCIKRFMDICLSLIGIFFTLPFQIVVAILIKLTSRGPIFYTQERTGMYEQPFIIYKYRTMTIDAEKTGPQQAKANDARVTWIGKYLRRTRFDELPQLWNIIKGDMSLIGPRPERPHFTNQYKEKISYYFLRHAVRPGLTGWAQVRHEYTNDFEGTCEKFRHDLYYIKNFSIGLDFIILIKTVKVVLTGSGAK